MTLVNETGQEVFYSISCANSGDCGTIEVDGVADLPYYDNQTNVVINFVPAGQQTNFTMTVEDSGTDEQVQMLVVAE